MHCPQCASDTQAEFSTEINIHFSGLRNIDRPGLLVFPKLLVCLECGYSRFTTPKPELALLAFCVPESDPPTEKRDVRNAALRCPTAA